MDELLTVKQVADLLQLHEMTIRRYIKTGKLGVVRIGRNVRVPRRAVEALMAEREEKSLSEAPPTYQAQPRPKATLPEKHLSAHQRKTMTLLEAEQDTRSREEIIREFDALLAQIELEGNIESDALHDDPLLKLAGSVESELPDVADSHDKYIGEALRREYTKDIC